MSALIDSRPFVVFSDRPSTPYTPRRCNVRVSSRPSARLPAADWFRSSSSCWIDWRAARASSYSGGALETRLLTLGHVTHHVLAAIDTVAPGRAEGLPHGRPEPLARSPAAPGRHRGRSTKDRRNGVNTCSFSVSVSTKPRNRLSPVIDAQRDDHRRLGERLAVQHEGHNVLPGGSSRSFVALA